MAYILSIIISLLVALTVTPAPCYMLLAKDKLRNIEPPIINLLQPFYAKSLGLISNSPYLIIIATLLFCLAGLSVLPRMEGQFIQNLREGHYIVHTSSTAGTSSQESIRVGNQLTKSVLEIPGVVSVSQWAGDVLSVVRISLIVITVNLKLIWCLL